jgi:NAD+ synthase (glutamine-hydrolysing)
VNLIRFGAAALNQTPLAWDRNQANIAAAIEAARADGVSILCLPELCITGYGCEDAFHSSGVHRTAIQILEELVPLSRDLIVSIGLPVYFNKAVYNGAALAVDGRLAGIVAKQYLAGDGIHYEPRWFKPWPQGLRTTIEIGGLDVPLGDLHFECGGVKIGFEICEDAWVALRPGSQLALKGVDVILNPSASHFAFGKQAIRERFIIEGSRAFGVTYVYANLLGNEAGRIIYDGGAVIANGGHMIAAGPRFSYQDVELTTTTVDVDANRIAQARTGSYRPTVGEPPVETAFHFPARVPEPDPPRPPPWEWGERRKEEEFSRAVALGLFDYLRKSRSRGFVVSLSGGADSSACAVLVALMIRFGIASLGREAFIAKLDHIPGLADLDEVGLTRALLLCAYQATENSGDVTLEAARGVAAGVGAELLDLDVDPLFKGYVSLIEGALGRRLSWDTDDIALQNIQARVRGPGVWMLANLRDALLLATSNRSEAAVGYATMDGDTCGGLSPIAGIDKAFLRRWLEWMESAGPTELGALPALGAVNRQQPTAELRPPSAEQTDEGDLMPYPLLDAIEGAAIRDKHTPLEVYLEMRARFPDLPGPRLAGYVERFFRLWCRNQWKRERYAPSFHLDDKNLDPKTWCRFPILSGGFERELAELAAYVSAGQTREA